MDLELKSRIAVVSGASIGIGRAIAKMLALEGVRVAAVARRKDLLEALAQEVRAEGGAEGEIPVGYWREPEDLAALAVFLASSKARYITGAVIPVDGGLRRYQF